MFWHKKVLYFYEVYANCWHVLMWLNKKEKDGNCSHVSGRVTVLLCLLNWSLIQLPQQIWLKLNFQLKNAQKGCRWLNQTHTPLSGFLFIQNISAGICEKTGGMKKHSKVKVQRCALVKMFIVWWGGDYYSVHGQTL